IRLHHLGIACDAVAMKRGLHQTALPHVEVAFARQQTFTEEEFGALEGTAFHERALLRHQHVANQIGMIDEIEMLRAEGEMRDVAELARNARQKSEESR